MNGPIHRSHPAVPISTKSHWRSFRRSPKGALTLLFLPWLLVADLAAGWSATWPHVLSAVAGTTLFELAFERRRHGWAWPSSAFLSGLIVAFVLGPETPWAVTFAVGAWATASKYILRTRRGHLFNPAALALLVSVPILATDQSWWGAVPDLPWPGLLVLAAGGAVIVDRINKFPLVLAFAGTYFGLFTGAAYLDPARVAEMFRPPFVNAAVFFALFMLTDPPTSPSRDRDQIWVGALVAGVSWAAQLLGAGQSYLLIGLLVGNVALVLRRRTRDAATRRAVRPAGQRPVDPERPESLAEAPVIWPGADRLGEGRRAGELVGSPRGATNRPG